MNDKEKAQKEIENLISDLSHKGSYLNAPTNRAQYFERDAALRKKLKTVLKILNEI